MYDLIISFVPRVGPSWLHLRLVSKTFLASCERIQDPSSQNNEPIIRASAKGQVTAVQKLLRDPRVNPRARECEAMVRALEEKHEEVVRALLVDGRISPIDHHQDRTMTVRAMEMLHFPTLEVLINDPRFRFTTNPHPVTWAVSQGMTSIVRGLRRHQNYRSNTGITRLCFMRFPKGEHMELAREILKMDGSVGRLFVDFFEDQAKQGNLNTIKMLIKDYPDKLGRFHFGGALLGATSSGHIDVLRELLAHKRFTKKNPMTLSLWAAVKGGHYDMFRCLIDHKDSPGMDIFYSARGKSHMRHWLCHPAIAMEIIGYKAEGVGQRLAECLCCAKKNRLWEMVEKITSDPRLRLS
jgi:hypothetical protein